MVERELEGLIQDTLDGVATPEQTARLEALLSRNPAGLERQRELEEVFDALRRVPQVEFPPDLREGILRAVGARHSVARGEAPVRLRGPGLGPRVRYAYVFAAGLAAGVVGLGAVSGLWRAAGPGGPAVSGSMMPSGPQTGALSRTWKAGPAALAATSWRLGATRFVSLRIQGPGSTDVELTFEAGALAPVSVRRPPGARGRVVVEPGRVTFEGVDGGEYLLEVHELSGAAPPLGVSLHGGGTTSTGWLPARETSAAGR